eukprot:5471464-Pyramimonas_sp.AAC.1
MAAAIARPPTAEEMRDKAAAQHIRKAHNAWDKVKRDLQSTIVQSKARQNTKGCKFEKDMADRISAGGAGDAALAALEQKYMRNERCTNALHQRPSGQRLDRQHGHEGKDQAGQQFHHGDQALVRSLSEWARLAVLKLASVRHSAPPELSW